MNKSNLEHCPLCGEKSYQHRVKSMTLHYKSQPITVKQPGYWCSSCNDGVIGGEDRKATQKELQTQRAKIDGLLPPDEIKKIREQLNLTQQQAGELFGGGVNAFSRYERGETPVPRALSQIFTLLHAHPELLPELTNQTEMNLSKIKKRKIARN